LDEVAAGFDDPVKRKTATMRTTTSATTPPKMRRLRFDDLAGAANSSLMT
jgi:hypothetical protein